MTSKDPTQAEAPAVTDAPVVPDDWVPSATRRVRRPRVLWIAAAVFVVLALVGSFAWALRPQPNQNGVAASTAQQAVRGFLDALAADDADQALQYALNRPTDTTLLTRAVLESSHQTGALTVVNVPEVTGAGTVQVPAEVSFGEHRATITFSVTPTEAGWRLGQVTSTIDPGPLPSDLIASLNGQPLSGTSHLEVFPGLYTFSEKVPEIALEGNPVLVAAVGEDVRAGLQPTLTSKGEKVANALAARAVDECMEQRKPEPKDCPNSVTVAQGQKIDTKTIKWNLVGNPWKNATYTLDVTDPTQARGATTLTFRFRCTLTQNGEKYTVDQTNSVDMRYLLTVTDHESAVVWQRVG
ncbi:hypothetical protein [Micropruina sp.]|uniref:hypothetical protein n=1 Tax=Micropruina sp. TaxID=2737536 RepID=UPI0039E234B5